MDWTREWITIKRRKLLWREFICILDDYRYRDIIRKKGEALENRYCSMIFALQVMTDYYHQGQDYISEQPEDFLEYYNMRLPVEKKLPEALDELFEQLQSDLNIDLTELLDKCVEKTEKAYQRMLKQEQTEATRLASVSSLLKEIGNFKSEETEDKINILLKLQKAKLKSPDYKMEENEIIVTNIWCELLVTSIFSDVITYGQMQKLIENELLEDWDISELLKNNYHIEKDYKWYSENFLGCELDTPTDIKIKDIFSLCEKHVNEILGITEKDVNW